MRSCSAWASRRSACARARSASASVSRARASCTSVVEAVVAASERSSCARSLATWSLLRLIALAISATARSAAEGSAADRAPLTALTGYLHVKDVLDLASGSAGSADVVVPSERVRTLPQLSVSAPVDEALAALRREGSHLARAVDADGTTVGVVALEDLVEEYVGTVRDSTHVGRPSATATRQRPL